MSRVITALAWDLKFNVLLTPPACAVGFTNTAADGHESQGRVTLVDAAAQRVWDAPDKLAAVNAELDALEAALPDLPTIAARMTAVDDLDRQLRAKQAQIATVDAQIATKQAEVAALATAAPVTAGT